MVVGVALLRHWGRGGVNQGLTSLRPAAVEMGMGGSSHLQRIEDKASSYSLPLGEWTSGPWTSPHPPGALDTHHWSGGCF